MLPGVTAATQPAKTEHIRATDQGSNHNDNGGDNISQALRKMYSIK